MLSVVERRRRRVTKDKQEEEEGVGIAMATSLKEGWSLLLQLLSKRQEVLNLASEFYSRSLQVLIRSFR